MWSISVCKSSNLSRQRGRPVRRLRANRYGRSNLSWSARCCRTLHRLSGECRIEGVPRLIDESLRGAISHRSATGVELLTTRENSAILWTAPRPFACSPALRRGRFLLSQWRRPSIRPLRPECDRIAYVAFAASLNYTDGRKAAQEKGREVAHTDEDAHEAASAGCGAAVGESRD
jgi:hypothetical protein